MSAAIFNTLQLSTALLNSLTRMGYQTMTPIQAQAIPVILEGQDLIAQAQTGSGKTIAFGIGILQKINPRFLGFQALILCPTRELAEQVSTSLRKLASSIANIKIVSLCGGAPIGPQIGSLAHGGHIVVGTPGRIEEHLRQGYLTLKWLRIFVLDEADRLLDMGFNQSIQAIAEYLPHPHQTLLFSATFPKTIESLTQSVLKNPREVRLSVLNTAQITQRFYEIAPQQRLVAVEQLIRAYQPNACVIFCATKQQTQELYNALKEKGIAVVQLHGDLEQPVRTQTLALFANQSSRVLVATDVAARGLDIATIDMVINAELARDPEVHIHRIGRTGRAGATGIALSLVAPTEALRAQAIQETLGADLDWADINTLPKTNNVALTAKMHTLSIAAGRKEKLRAGDIVGALTASTVLNSSDIGTIQLFEHHALVAVTQEAAAHALTILANHPIKGRIFKVRMLYID